LQNGVTDFLNTNIPLSSKAITQYLSHALVFQWNTKINKSPNNNKDAIDNPIHNHYIRHMLDEHA